MAGLYVHIPFCKKRCLYCDFFSTTLLERREEYVTALVREIEARKQEAGEPIRTIYIGGGTPSTLEVAQIQRILAAAGTQGVEEITMELNPGDAAKPYLQALRETGINRLSIGIQSFRDELLQLIGRRHSAEQAIQAVQMAQEAGFDNLSIDLIYALPTQTMAQWIADIETAISLKVQHISSYGLMYEEGTALTTMRDRGEVTPVDEDTENDMYDTLCARLKEAGFIHYEVSNFALPGFRSRHNSSYWTDESYIGLGAGAHSYDARLRIRSWNVSDLNRYIDATGKGIRPCEQETLTDGQHRIERIMLGLRTSEGIEKSLLDSTPSSLSAGSTTAHSIPRSQARLHDYLSQGLLRDTGTRYVVTRDGIRLLNRIIGDII